MYGDVLQSSAYHYGRPPVPAIEILEPNIDYLQNMTHGTLQLLVCDDDDRVLMGSDVVIMDNSNTSHLKMRFFDGSPPFEPRHLVGKMVTLVHKMSGEDQNGCTIFRAPLCVNAATRQITTYNANDKIRVQPWVQGILEEDDLWLWDDLWFSLFVSVVQPFDWTFRIDLVASINVSILPRHSVVFGLLTHLADLQRSQRSRPWARAKRRLQVRAICLYWMDLTADSLAIREMGAAAYTYAYLKTSWNQRSRENAVFLQRRDTPLHNDV